MGGGSGQKEAEEGRNEGLESSSKEIKLDSVKNVSKLKVKSKISHHHPDVSNEEEPYNLQGESSINNNNGKISEPRLKSQLVTSNAPEEQVLEEEEEKEMEINNGLPEIK